MEFLSKFQPQCFRFWQSKIYDFLQLHLQRNESLVRLQQAVGTFSRQFCLPAKRASFATTSACGRGFLWGSWPRCWRRFPVIIFVVPRPTPLASAAPKAKLLISFFALFRIHLGIAPLQRAGFLSAAPVRQPLKWPWLAHHCFVHLHFWQLIITGHFFGAGRKNYCLNWGAQRRQARPHLTGDAALPWRR